MIYKVDLNSNNYFSTNNINTSDNRTYAYDSSIFQQDKKYSMTHNFLSKRLNLSPYPPAAITGNNTVTLSGQEYGNGQYIVSFSSESGANVARNAYNKAQVTYWRTSTNYPGGNYTGSAGTNLNGGGTIMGEWNNILLPNAIVLDSFYFEFNRTNSVEFRNFAVLGSNNGTTFDILYRGSIDLPAAIGVYFEVLNKSTAYNRFRFIAESGSGLGPNYIELSEWILYEDRSKFENGLISINMGSFGYNYQGTSLTQKKSTHLAGLLSVKNKNLYSKSHQQSEVFFNSAPNDNFITINLLKMDNITPYDLKEPYYLSLFFEEIE
jgi:hypothetical protein